MLGKVMFPVLMQKCALPICKRMADLKILNVPDLLITDLLTYHIHLKYVYLSIELVLNYAMDSVSQHMHLPLALGTVFYVPHFVQLGYGN